MTAHVFLVAVSMDTPDGMSRADAEIALHRVMPRPGDAGDGPAVECWWIAEDDRRDGSDNGSAVFVDPGAQRAAFTLLHAAGLTPDHNDPLNAVDSHFEGPEVQR